MPVDPSAFGGLGPSPVPEKLSVLAGIGNGDPSQPAVEVDLSNACCRLAIDECAIAPNDEWLRFGPSDALHTEARLTGRGGDTSYSSMIQRDGR